MEPNQIGNKPHDRKWAVTKQNLSGKNGLAIHLDARIKGKKKSVKLHNNSLHSVMGPVEENIGTKKETEWFK